MMELFHKILRYEVGPSNLIEWVAEDRKIDILHEEVISQWLRGRALSLRAATPGKGLLTVLIS